jgi:hypothetical protein
MFCRKWGVDARTMQKRDLTPAFVEDLKQAAVALTRDAKLGDLIELKLQRLS